MISSIPSAIAIRSGKPIMADRHIFRDVPGGPDHDVDFYEDKIKEMRRDGVAECRVKMVDDQHLPVQDGTEPAGYWIEGWFTKPESYVPFSPPLTYTDTAPSECEPS